MLTLTLTETEALRVNTASDEIYLPVSLIFGWHQEHNFHACLATERLGFLFMAAWLIMSHISVMQVKEAENLL